MEIVGGCLRWLIALVIGLPLLGLAATASKAQCVDSSERVQPIALQMFAADPASLLRQLRNEKEKLSGRLSGYIASDISILPAVRRLISDAPNADRGSIGSALRRAESRCLITKPEAAHKINDFVRKLGDNAVLAGYSSEAEQPLPPPPATKTVGTAPGLMSGEWKTELADPFASMPLPQ